MEDSLTMLPTTGALATLFDSLDSLEQVHCLTVTDLPSDALSELSEIVGSHACVRVADHFGADDTLLLQHLALEHHCHRLEQRITQYRSELAHAINENTQLRLKLDMDAKSQIPNYSGILHWSRAMAELAVRNRVPIAITFLDYNAFKMINDNYGHETGDKVIELTGEFLRHEVSIGEYAGRFGGEEFVIGLYARPLPDHSPVESVAMGLQRILNGLTMFIERELFHWTEMAIPFLGFAAGTVCYTPSDQRLEALIWTAHRSIEVWGPEEGASYRIPSVLDATQFEKDKLGEYLIRLADRLMYESKSRFRAKYADLISDRD